MPSGIYNRNKGKTPPAPGAAVPPASASPVRQQVKELSGFSTREALKDALPESTATPINQGTEPEKIRKTRQKREIVDDGNDPRFNEAVAGMTSLGGSRAIRTAFKSAAAATKKKELELKEDEQKQWDDFFYVVGKKSQFDPTRPWYLVLYALVLLTEQIVSRLWALNSKTFGKSFFSFLMPDEKEESQPVAAGEDEDEFTA